MRESNKLTEQKYWRDSWKKIKLPARYFYENYSHIIISDLIDKFISPEYKTFLEIGGCPGRWADYFYTKHRMVCDSMDYDEDNVKLTQENYKILGIEGKAFVDDITHENINPLKKYDVVLSDGLVEHFIDSREIFKNHLKYLKKEGLLIIGVPNIKRSWFYDYFSKNASGYSGYRHVSIEELKEYTINNNLSILFCGYIGVFNPGLVNTGNFNFLMKNAFTVVDIFSSFFMGALKIRKESSILSPYIFLIAKK